MASNGLTEQKAATAEMKTQIKKIRDHLLAKLDELNACVDSAEKLNQKANELVKNLETSLATVTAETSEWQQMKAKLATTAVQGKVILDIGGDKFTTSVETLTREKDTFFTALFSRQWELERDPKDESIFIDRDGKLFAHILGYLRTDTISSDVMTTETLRQKVIAEAKYYQMNKLVEVLTEPERKKAAQKEAAQKEAARKEAARKEAERKEAERKKAEQNQQVKSESTSPMKA